ncbi:questin oxidase family protein [Pseudokineococcus sp. 1T1Z-3]|uniref:questin oxidase family protein n=1 Tax=Pseudokineococcus sp. 1T1Z-3 TaxID=3132745 RepID=UPI0030A8A2FE
MDTTTPPTGSPRGPVPGDDLDETWTRLRATGPEFQGWLSNHGPMAADALWRLGRGEHVQAWVDGYATRLQEAPAVRWPITEDEWRDVLGDPSRLGDWLDLFDRQLREEPWRDVVVRWWPRLLDGAVASATHSLIRTGHAVRALLEDTTPARTAELAQALGYWAARHQRLPDHPRPAGHVGPTAALDAVPALSSAGGVRARLGELSRTSAWPAAVGRLRAAPPAAEVPAAVDALVDAAVTGYRRWAHGSPVMLVHAATAPRAAGLVLPALPRELWAPTYETAWAVSAAITAAYRPTAAPPPASRAEQATTTPEDVTDRAVATGDEHAIKFVEVAQESHRRGNPDALPAGARASHLIAPVDYS